MEKHVRIGWLMDFYGGLLTGRQREMLSSYYNEDLSLAEIAQDEGVSRQAVHDALRRGETALEGFESRLGLLSRHLALGEVLTRGQRLLEDGAMDKAALLEVMDQAISIWEREGEHGL